MFAINNIQDSAGKPTKLQMYTPHVPMCISPYVGLDLYSDDAQACDGSGFPSGGSIASAPTSLNNSANLGTISALADKYLPTSANPFDGIFPYDDKKMADDAFQYYGFSSWFRKYKRFKNLNYYPFLKDATKIPSGAVAYVAAANGIVREVNSTTAVWLRSTSANGIQCTIGTIAADGTITWGASVTVPNSANSQTFKNFDVCSIDTNKIAVLYYTTTANKAAVVIATISGTTPSFGSEVQINGTASAMTLGCKIIKDSTDKLIATYTLANAITYLRVATVATTTPTFGTEETVGTSSSTTKGLALNASGSFLVTRAEASVLKARAATILGTTITMGAEVTIYTGAALTLGGSEMDKLKKIDTNKYLAVDTDTTPSLFVATVITVSGTVVTANTAYTFLLSAAQSYYIHEVTSGSEYIVYHGGSKINRASKISISGTVITFPKTNNRVLFDSEQYCTGLDGLGLSVPTKYNASTVMGASFFNGMARVGDFVVYLNAVSTSIVNYMVAHADSEFEAHNDDTIIGAAFDANDPFVLTNQSIDSAVNNAKAYLKIKNTSGGERSMLIETVLMEVD